MLMPRTLLKTSWRHLVRHPWQFALAVLGVALGVAVVVAIDLANDSARRAFALSTETIAGRATHQITGGPTGLDEALYRQLRVDLGFRSAAPLVEGYAAAPEHPGLTLHILGVDPLAEGPFRSFGAQAGGSQPAATLPPAFFLSPGAALMSVDTARRNGIAEGDELALRFGGRTVPATVVGLLEPENDASRRALDGLLLVDIATAQEWLGKLGRLDRIDLLVPQGAAGEAELERIQALLPPGAEISTPARRTSTIQQMTAAFELNLLALSLLALVVGMFLIYNTITFSVVQRRSQIGTLRCLGVTRGQVFTLVLGEALLVGVLGTLAGLALGLVLGRGLVGLVTQTINDLYFAVTVREIAISRVPLVKGFVLGMGATLLAAALPAAEATATPARTVLRRSSYEERVRRLLPQIAAAGMALMAVGVALLLVPSTSIVLAFAGLLLLVLGAAAVTPLCTLFLMQLARPLMGRAFGLLGRMAARDVVASLSRTSVAVAALMIAVSVTIGVGLMVGSFRNTVVSWLDSTIRADVFVSAPSVAANRLDQPLPPAVVERLVNAAGVERARRYRSVTVSSAVGPLLTIALEVAPADRAAFQWVGSEPPGVWDAYARGEALISEPLAYRHGLRVGDTLTVRSDGGDTALRVAGVFYDYGSDQGVLMLNLERYRALWNDQNISSLGLYAAPGVDVDALVQELRVLASEYPVGAEHAPPLLDIRSNRALRETSLEIFDRTFAITGVLQLLATIVAFVGILAALMALQLERARELGVLRANGLTPAQLWGLVLGQTGLMGLAAGALAAPVGVMMATVLVYVINKRSFGWTLLFNLDGALFVQAMLVAVTAALLAGLYPAWRMGRTSPALALREE
jgi:putative ABC transport system permease protein